MSVIIRLQNLPITANAASIRRFFAGLSIPEGGVHIVGGEDGDAFIAFATDEDARKAMQLDRQPINNAAVRLLLSSKNEMQAVIDSAKSSALVLTQPVQPTQPSVSHRPPPPSKSPQSDYYSRPSYLSSASQPPHSQPHYGQEANEAKPPHHDPWEAYHQNPYEPPPNHAYEPHDRVYGAPEPHYHAPANAGREVDPRDSSRSYPHKDPRARPAHPYTGDPYYDTHRSVRPDYSREHGHDAYQSENAYHAERWGQPPPRDALEPSHKRPPPPDEHPYHDSAYPDPPVKQRRAEEFGRENSWIVRMTIVPQEVAILQLFDFFKSVGIVQNYGVRLEKDVLGRNTGYVYIMLTNEDSYNRALRLDGALFRGKPASIRSSSDKEFFEVYDPLFRKRCPKELLHRLPVRSGRFSSPYCADGYVELDSLPRDTTAREVVTFIGAPGLTQRDVLLVGYGPEESRQGVRALVRLPSPGDIDILLSARPRLFRDGMREPVQLTPISKPQFELFSRFELPSQTEDPRRRPSSPVERRRDDRVCLHMFALSGPVVERDLVLSVKSTRLDPQDVRVLSGRNGLLVQLSSESTASRVAEEIDSVFRRRNPGMVIERIRRETFDSIWKQDQQRGETPSPREKPGQLPPPKQPPPAPESAGGSAWPPTDSYGRPRGARPNYPPSHFAGRPRMGPPPPGFYGPPRPTMRPGPMGGVPARPCRPAKDGHIHVHISGLDPNVTKGDLARELRRFNPVFGSIDVYRKSADGFASIAFINPMDADAAIQHLRAFPIGGRRVVPRFDKNFHG